MCFWCVFVWLQLLGDDQPTQPGGPMDYFFLDIPMGTSPRNGKVRRSRVPKGSQAKPGLCSKTIGARWYPHPASPSPFYPPTVKVEYSSVTCGRLLKMPKPSWGVDYVIRFPIRLRSWDRLCIVLKHS